jgi:tmRNA-binding protein
MPHMHETLNFILSIQKNYMKVEGGLFRGKRDTEKRKGNERVM